MNTLTGKFDGLRPGEAAGFRPARLRVLIVEPHGSGGNWHYAHALSGALLAAGLEVVLGTLSPVENLADLDQVRVRIIGVSRRGSTWSPSTLARRMLNHVGKLIGLIQVVNEFRPDVVHLHDPVGKLDFLYMRVLRLMGSKIVYTAYSPRPLSWKVTWFDWARYRGADAVLVHSENAVADLVSAGVDIGRIVQIPHGNFLRFCDNLGLNQIEARRLLSLPDSARVVLFFGGISPHKGVDVLIEAFSRALRVDPDLRLVIAGDPRMDVSEYERTIERLALGSRVLMDLRYIPFGEFAKFFVACDVVALPYRRNYQSGILQLAYGFGRPVIVTDVGGISDAVRSDETGVVAGSGDAQALAEAIRQILADPESTRMMGRRARHVAETKYSWGAVARIVTEVYESVSGRNRGIH